MDAFSSKPEDSLNKEIIVGLDAQELLITCEEELTQYFELNKCVKYIVDKKCSKVCLQFPDSLLQYAVQVALFLEKKTNQKVFILGDTSYGSCCVDEVAAEHIDGDCVIHFGYACLSRNSRLPVLHILPRASLDISLFISSLSQHISQVPGIVLILYDVAFSHFTDEMKTRLSELSDRVVLSQLSLAEREESCGSSCQLTQGLNAHSMSLLGRTFCCQQFPPPSVVYVTHNNSQNMINFALTFRDSQFFTYSNKDNSFRAVDFSKTLRRRLFLVEKVKDAKTLGIIVGTLSVERFVSAINQVKRLAKYRGKRCYVFSVGKPNPAKLANFPEIEVFVMVSCPEACLEDEKQYMQPIVTLLEAEIALNPNRQWDDNLSVDYTNLLEGGLFYKSIPEGQEPLAADVSLLSNRIRCSDTVKDNLETGTELSIKDNYQISIASSYASQRSWKGLEQALGETPVSQVTKGRSGIPLAYDEEKPQLPS